MANVTADFSLYGALDALMHQPILPEELQRMGKTVDDLSALMDNDVISSTWTKRPTAVEQRRWSLTGDTSKVSRFLRDAIAPIYTDFIRALLNARLYGLSAPEITYELDGDRLLPTRLIHHPTSNFYVDDGGQVGVVRYGERNLVKDDKILNAKFFPLVSNRTHKYKAGTAMLGSMYWVGHLSGNLWEFWGRYLERYGSPSLVGTTRYAVNPETGKSSIVELRNAMLELMNSGVGAFVDGTTITPLQTWNVGDGFRMADDKLLTRIQMFFLGQTLTTQQGSSGSHALGMVHQDVLREIVAGDITFVTPAVQKLINTLTALNFPGKTPPVYEIDFPTKLNAERAARDKQLWDTGLRFTPSYYKQHYGFSDDEIEAVVEPVHATGVVHNGDKTSVDEPPTKSDTKAEDK